MKFLFLITLVITLAACKSSPNPVPFVTEKGDLSIGVTKEAIERDCFGFEWCVKLDGARRVVWEDGVMDVKHFCKSCGGVTYVNIDHYKCGEAKHAHQCDKFRAACDRVGGLMTAIEEYCIGQPANCVEYYQEFCNNGDTDEDSDGVIMDDGGAYPDTDTGDAGVDGGTDTGI